MPHKMNLFGCIVSADERYIVTFGGEGRTERMDEIWILDLEVMTWRQSKMKCPITGCFHAVSISSSETAELCGHGWIRAE